MDCCSEFICVSNHCATLSAPDGGDAGTVDAGGEDAGGADAGTADAGTVDAGPACDASMHECGGQCVSDLAVATCGQSCTACPGDVNGAAVCDGQGCGLSCLSGFLLCGGRCAPCPSASGALRCAADQCVLGSCQPGEHPCASGCCPWTIELVDPGGDKGWISSLALDATGRPHVAYADSSNYDLKYAHREASGWVAEKVSGDGPSSVSLAIGSNGKPRIAFWYDFIGNTFDIRFAEKTAAGWTTETVVKNTGREASLTLDALDQPHVSYHDTANSSMSWARRVGTTWVTQQVAVIGLPRLGPENHIRLDGAGVPQIGYRDFSAQNLKHAKWTGTVWQISSVDSAAANPGGANSMALDSQGNAHFAYYEDANSGGGLRYAHWTGSGWANETVEAGALVGYSVALAIDRNDTPHIAYYDLSTPPRKSLPNVRRRGPHPPRATPCQPEAQVLTS